METGYEESWEASFMKADAPGGAFGEEGSVDYRPGNNRADFHLFDESQSLHPINALFLPCSFLLGRLADARQDCWSGRLKLFMDRACDAGEFRLAGGG
jgi:hypothetical protein